MQGRMKGKRGRAVLSAVAATVAIAVAIAVPAAAQACERDGARPTELTVREARGAVLCLINERRGANGVGMLLSDDRLKRAAQRHSKSMDNQNFFSHNSSSDGSPLSRIQRAGYLAGATSWGIAENIRWGNGGRGSPKAAVARWMASPPHRSALLSGRFRQIGVGVAIGSPTGNGGSNAAIYTTTFGYRG